MMNFAASDLWDDGIYGINRPREYARAEDDRFVMMNFVFKMMNFVFKMMNFVFK